MFLVIGGLSMMSHHYTLGNIKSRTVGDGQHGTARWATDKEIKQTYAHVPFKVREWRSGQNLLIWSVFEKIPQSARPTLRYISPGFGQNLHKL